MGEIGIITHYDVHNHGALLQLNALIKILEEKGFKAYALRFDKNYDFMGHELKKRYEISIRSLGIYLKFLFNRGLGCTLYNVRKHSTLNKFRSAQSLVGAYYSESKPLDFIIVGSDEVFALHTGPTPVFFGHCLPTDNVISYAGSFGPTVIEDINRLHCRNLIASGLSNMKGVTVRDANSADIVSELTGKVPEIVVDPVLLYGYKKEISALPKVKHGKYLLVYSYDNRMNTTEEISAIKQYAKARGLKLLSPGFYHSWCDFNVNVDPIGLLAYFRDAEEVLTDTFHGAVMSIIAGATFVVKTRENNYLKLHNLLKEYRLDDRIIKQWDQLSDVFSANIDWNTVNDEVAKRRSASYNALNKMLDYSL